LSRSLNTLLTTCFYGFSQANIPVCHRFTRRSH
jgi:hypothetical protein